MTKAKASVLLIYTGGTIGMKEGPSGLAPFDFSQILEETATMKGDSFLAT